MRLILISILFSFCFATGSIASEDYCKNWLGTLGGLNNTMETLKKHSNEKIKVNVIFWKSPMLWNRMAFSDGKTIQSYLDGEPLVAKVEEWDPDDLGRYYYLSLEGLGQNVIKVLNDFIEDDPQIQEKCG